MEKFDLIKYLDENKSYCPRPFRDVWVSNKGEYKLCCEASKWNPVKKFNVDTHTPFEYFNSPEMNEIRNMMLDGIKVPTCTFCHEAEDRGYKSFRYEYKEQWAKEVFTDVKNVHIKLRINGSFCNLSCYMCWPQNSSERRKTIKETLNAGGFVGEFEFGASNKATKSKTWDEVIKDILDNIHLIERIHMTGGEPLQLPRHWKFLDQIPDEHAKNIRLTYDTNLTELRYNNHSIYDNADRFKDMSFSVSADHYGEREAWIRYPKNVKDWESKIKEAIEYIEQINITPSILNGEHLLEIRKYYKEKFNIKAIVSNTLADPYMLSIKNYPQDIKDRLIDKYENTDYEWQRVLSELEKPRVEEEWQNGLRYCRELSKTRGEYTELWQNLI